MFIVRVKIILTLVVLISNSWGYRDKLRRSATLPLNQSSSSLNTSSSSIPFSLFNALKAENSLKVGVMEFIAKNDVGTPDAGRISAVLVNNELKQIGIWRMLERIQLNEILNEQSLQMLNDDSSAVATGALAGAQAMVSGSLMRIGKMRILTARLIDVQSGELLQSASVRFSEPEELEKASLKIAHLLSGKSERQYFTLLTERDLKSVKVNATVGTGWGQTRIEHRFLDYNENGKAYDNYTQHTQTDVLGLMLEAGLRSYYIDLDVGGIVPNHTGLLKTQVGIYPFTHFGLAYTYVKENHSVVEDGFEWGAMNWTTHMLGFKIRTSSRFSFGFYKGKSTEGKVLFKDPNMTVPTQIIKDEINILQGPTLATFEFLIGQNQFLKATYYHNLESTDLFAAEHPKYRIYTNHKIIGYSRLFGLQWGMSFGL